ncbi:IQ domain-containing protein IQM1-like [Cynara cardunculus var. scolymus]|uniref:IQ domain-containing protein IQM1-like n=1 Tax=Cynara cardunculus var. scolymus TaxID=59895 RepID=UPI000D6288AB|nr:IQ domain-containing protein IQM1-like [Cynara cardunculus var. scolymus]
MGLSLSLLSSAWEEILNHSFLILPYELNLGLKVDDTFDNISKSETISKEPDRDSCDDDQSRRNSISSKRSHEPLKIMLETTLSFKNLVQDFKKPEPDHLNLRTDRLPASPGPTIFFSPRPVSELNAAATTVQKIYKSYRTRRNLADCAIVVEELWWKALDFAALDRSSVSFFNLEKPETAVSRWARARTRAAKVGKGLCKNEKAQKLALQHWLEAIDPRHRYGHNLHIYYDIWFKSESSQPFFYWLDVGDGKEINLEKCPRIRLQRQCIKYLGPNERESYEVIVENGKLVYRQSGLLLETIEGSKWIFVLSTTKNLYVGQKKKGLFQHSSFLSGGATTAAGRLVAHGGILEAIWPYSGHYLPTEENFRDFISFLEENHVDLTDVKRCSVDDDDVGFSFKVTQTETKPKPLVIPRPRPQDILRAPTHAERTITLTDAPISPSLQEADRMSCKWTSGTGPRIGCVRDYPSELQFMALEKVHLSPRIIPGNFGPIPSPRPSPKVRLSPRISYMGIPSPRTPIATN